jgi:hypothetical protein
VDGVRISKLCCIIDDFIYLGDCSEWIFNYDTGFINFSSSRPPFVDLVLFSHPTFCGFFDTLLAFGCLNMVDFISFASRVI